MRSHTFRATLLKRERASSCENSWISGVFPAVEGQGQEVQGETEDGERRGVGIKVGGRADGAKSIVKLESST